jgi:hypothetical protein
MENEAEHKKSTVAAKKKNNIARILHNEEICMTGQSRNVYKTWNTKTIALLNL